MGTAAKEFALDRTRTRDLTKPRLRARKREFKAQQTLKTPSARVLRSPKSKTIEKSVGKNFVTDRIRTLDPPGPTSYANFTTMAFKIRSRKKKSTSKPTLENPKMKRKSSRNDAFRVNGPMQITIYGRAASAVAQS